MLCHGRPLDMELLVDKTAVNSWLFDLVLELLHEIVVKGPCHERSAVATDWYWLQTWRRALSHGWAVSRDNMAKSQSSLTDLSTYPVRHRLRLGRSSARSRNGSREWLTEIP